MATTLERARTARDAANLAHELERHLLSIAESIGRGEAPDVMAVGLLPGLMSRIQELSAFTLAD